MCVRHTYTRSHTHTCAVKCFSFLPALFTFVPSQYGCRVFEHPPLPRTDVFCVWSSFTLNNTVQEQSGPAKPTAFLLDSTDTGEPGRSIIEWISPGNPGEHLVLSVTKSGVSLGSWHGVLAIPQAGLWPAKVS